MIDDDWWRCLRWRLIGACMVFIENVRPSCPSVYKWSRWWITMIEHRDGDDLVWLKIDAQINMCNVMYCNTMWCTVMYCNGRKTRTRILKHFSVLYTSTYVCCLLYCLCIICMCILCMYVFCVSVHCLIHNRTINSDAYFGTSYWLLILFESACL